jgi:hypothetical protein
MWWALALALFAVALTASAMPAGAADRLDHFREIAGRYAEAADQDADDALLSGLFEVVDAEVEENLRSGPPFSSAAFIQERLNAFSDAWGGAALSVVRAGQGTNNSALLGLFTVTRGEPRGSLRFYGRSDGLISLLAAVTHEGHVEVREWPAAGRFLASWFGAETGPGDRALHLELWRFPLGARPSRVWTSADTFPQGLRATGFATRNGQLVVRYQVQYPGWKPGCAGETEQEDLYRAPARGTGLTLVRRRVVNGWHRELQSAVTRLYAALGADDRRTLVELVADPSLRARLPRDLRAEAVCDERDPAAPATVIVAATRERDHQRVPWSLAWRRGPRGWRVAAAGPVLQ